MLDPNSLFEIDLKPSKFLARLRQVESFAVKADCSAIAYYSSKSAGRLLPKGPAFRGMLRRVKCVSIFSFDEHAVPDESTFLIFTTDGSLYIDINQVEAGEDTYSCSGFLGYSHGMRKFESLVEKSRNLDAVETERLFKAVNDIGGSQMESESFRSFANDWNSYDGDV